VSSDTCEERLPTLGSPRPRESGITLGDVVAVVVVVVVLMHCREIELLNKQKVLSSN